MTKPENSDNVSGVAEAIRAKHGRKTLGAEDIALLETSLLADIETFDLDAAERRARREQSDNSGSGMLEAAQAFPVVVPVSASQDQTKSEKEADAPTAQPKLKREGSSLLSELRQQAELRQREQHEELVDRSSRNGLIDQALKHLFFFLHDFVQQLNIVKPAIPRDFPLLGEYAINQLAWQEGFTDYRTQGQGGGALVELVTFTCRLSGNGVPIIEKEGAAAERFRRILFDYGLLFTCKEFKNKHHYVERAEFEIRGEVSVSARWRADFSKGILVLETRNLERLGSAAFTLHPQCVDAALLDEFGRLVLGQANRFRELAKRQ